MVADRAPRANAPPLDCPSPESPMNIRPLTLAIVLAVASGLAACDRDGAPAPVADDASALPESPTTASTAESDIAAKVADYAEVTLSSDLSHLAEGDRKAIGFLLQAGAVMDDLFWKQVVGDRDALLASIEDPAVRRFVEINYGPWDRL